MTEYCVGCRKRLWWWQKAHNGSWHHSCLVAWDKGYRNAMNFCDEQNRLWGYPTANEIYNERILINNQFMLDLTEGG